ncbi:MAG: hypothetical protein RLZZ577_53 [Bacteroidota bacterium]|jgi:hypothetical protein
MNKYIFLVTGIYLFILAIAISPNSSGSKMLLKFVPLILGLYSILSGLSMFGYNILFIMGRYF